MDSLTAELDHSGHTVPSLRVTVNLPATRPFAAAVFRYEKEEGKIRDLAPRELF